MTDNAPPDVTTARRTFEAAVEAEHEAQDALLAAIADGLGEHVEQTARRVTQEQPDHAHHLGREGIARLRAELASVADELANELTRSRTEIAWPTGSFVAPSQDAIRKALFDFLYGDRVDRLAWVLDNHGFEVSKSTSGTRSILNPFLPQSLYSQRDLSDQFDAVSEAAGNVKGARSALTHAEKASAEASVNDLWD